MKEISRSEYLTLKGEKVRILASMMIAFYFEPMMYWSFHNNPKNDAK